jgi:hypothetical protein
VYDQHELSFDPFDLSAGDGIKHAGRLACRDRHVKGVTDGRHSINITRCRQLLEPPPRHDTRVFSVHRVRSCVT